MDADIDHRFVNTTRADPPLRLKWNASRRYVPDAGTSAGRRVRGVIDSTPW